jgi:hypothetical protein
MVIVGPPPPYWHYFTFGVGKPSHWTALLQKIGTGDILFDMLLYFPAGFLKNPLKSLPPLTVSKFS